MQLGEIIFSQLGILGVELLSVVDRIDELKKVKKFALVVLKGCAY